MNTRVIHNLSRVLQSCPDDTLYGIVTRLRAIGTHTSHSLALSALRAHLLHISSQNGPYLIDVIQAIKRWEKDLCQGFKISPTPLRYGGDGTVLDTEADDSVGSYAYATTVVNLAYAAEGAIVGLDLSDFTGNCST